MTERDLIRRAQQGDQDALDELCKREWRPVFGIVYQAVRDRSDAQDLTQEVFLRALRSLDRYEHSGAPFRAYLRTIALNLVRDLWRKRQPLRVGIYQSDHLPARQPGPEEVAMRRVDERWIRKALDKLSDDHRRVLELRIFEGRDSNEVARMMGRSPAAVRQLQYRAIAALRAELKAKVRE